MSSTDQNKRTKYPLESASDSEVVDSLDDDDEDEDEFEDVHLSADEDSAEQNGDGFLNATSPLKRGRTTKLLSAAEKAMIIRVHANWMKAKVQTMTRKFGKMRINEVVAAICGVSKSTVTRVLKEYRETGSVRDSLGQGRKVRHLSSSQKGMMERVRDLILTRLAGGVVTSAAQIRSFLIETYTRDSLEEVLGKSCSIRQVQRLLRTWGYLWRSLSCKRKGYVETEEKTQEIAAWCKEMLRILSEEGNQRSSKRIWVSIDESWCQQFHASNSGWAMDDDNLIRTRKGPRWLLMDAVFCNISLCMTFVEVGLGNVNWKDLSRDQMGFVKHARDIRRATSAPSKDYHKCITWNYWWPWYTKMIDMLPWKNCLITLDNASFHCYRKGQTKSFRTYKKQELRDWLSSEGIPFGEKDTVPILRKLIKEKIPLWAEWYATNAGHTLMWQVANNSRLNPIEEVWLILKNYVRDNYTEGTSMDMVYDRLGAAYATRLDQRRIAGVFKHSVQMLKKEIDRYEAIVGQEIFIEEESENEDDMSEGEVDLPEDDSEDK